jgi:hypothetical protein
MTSRRVHTEPRRYWTEPELAMVAAQYPHMKTEVTARMLDRTTTTIYQQAQRMGLAKSPAYLALDVASRIKRGVAPNAVRHQFPKGHVPANKGLRRPGWGPGRMKATQFKKGAKPHTWRPVGSMRLNSEGYIDIKTDDTAKGPKAWTAIHRLNWIAANGPIPKGMLIRFKDGNPRNPLVENLLLITRRDHIRLNWHERYPKQIRQLVQLRGAITRQINKRTRT